MIKAILITGLIIWLACLFPWLWIIILIGAIMAC